MAKLIVRDYARTRNYRRKIQKRSDATLLSTLVEKVDAHDKRFDTLENKVDILSGQVIEIGRKVIEIDKRLSTVETRLASIEARLHSVEKRLDALEDEIKQIRSELISLVQKVSRLSINYLEANNRIEDLTERVERLEQKLVVQ